MKKNHYKYSIIIVWSEEDNGWGIKVPELPGCFSFASKFGDAPQMAEQAIASWIATTKKNGIEIPEPTSVREYSGKFVARINPKLHRELAMKAKIKGESLNSLVEELLNISIKA